MLSDIEIAQQAKVRKIDEIADELGIEALDLEPYGHYKAKLSLDLIKKHPRRATAKYIDVTAITPTPFGEGKTVTTVGLGQAFKRAGLSAITCVRQPSLGPVFGVKGGAAGGGYSQVLPMEDMNLHLTGDFHAISAAHNLCSAFLDNHIFHGNECEILPESIGWPRTMDISDRYLRTIEVGLGGSKSGIPRTDHFVITAASELMAILCLHEGLDEVKAALSRLVLASDKNGRPVTAADIQVAGSMAVLLKDAIKPNLLQNLEGGPVLVHAGPFANIAPGNSSIVADRMALGLADYVITESGFGADMGCEKFVNIKCRKSGMEPDCFVLVATVRALKSHAPQVKVKIGQSLPPELVHEDLDALRCGLDNLVCHIENCKQFGAPVVVAINSFPTDTAAEHALIKEAALAAGADSCVVHQLFEKGAEGGLDLVEAVVKACETPSKLQFTYTDKIDIKQKIEAVARQVFRAEGLELSEQAQERLELFESWGYTHLPVCMAKTQLSISDKPELKGAPKGWTLYVRDLKLSAGAGFIYALCGNMLTMPGLPKKPAGNAIDIDAQGCIRGLF